MSLKLKGEPEQITEGGKEYTEVWERKVLKARRLLKGEEKRKMSWRKP